MKKIILILAMVLCSTQLCYGWHGYVVDTVIMFLLYLLFRAYSDHIKRLISDVSPVARAIAPSMVLFG